MTCTVKGKYGVLRVTLIPVCRQLLENIRTLEREISMAVKATDK